MSDAVPIRPAMRFFYDMRYDERRVPGATAGIVRTFYGRLHA